MFVSSKIRREEIRSCEFQIVHTDIARLITSKRSSRCGSRYPHLRNSGTATTAREQSAAFGASSDIVRVLGFALFSPWRRQAPNCIATFPRSYGFMASMRLYVELVICFVLQADRASYRYVVSDQLPVITPGPRETMSLYEGWILPPKSKNNNTPYITLFTVSRD